MQKYLNLVSYFGGKYPHLKWLTSKFPKGNYHFVDIMCGGGNVALNVEYSLVTVNDVNDEIVNLFEVLRNDYDEFLRAVYFTPFSRAELNRIITDSKNGIEYGRVEMARRYFIRCQLGYGANGSQNNHYGTGFEYAIHKSNFYRADNWNVKLDRLARIVERLRHFQIEHRDAMELFEKVDKPGNLVYFDPPYLLSLRKSRKRYNHEVDDSFHRALAGRLATAKCFVAVSGHDSKLYDEIFAGFYKTVDVMKRSNTGKNEVRECLWTNYDTEKLGGTYKMDLR